MSVEELATKVFKACISIVYESFILELTISVSTALLFCSCGDKVKYGLILKKTTIWRFKKSHSNDKLLEKITSFSYHMEQKTFIEANCINNIHTREKLLKVCESFRFGQIKKLEVYFGFGRCESSFTFIERRRPSKYCLCEATLISYM